MATQLQTQPKLLFFVTNDPDGGYNAKEPKFRIFTQGDTWDELIANIKDAILCHFDEAEEHNGQLKQALKEILC